MSQTQAYLQVTFFDTHPASGGWTLVSYAYRAVAGGSTVYNLPNANSGAWDPVGRGGIAALNALSLVTSSSQMMLTVTNNPSTPVTGNALAYGLAYRWSNPGYTGFGESPLSFCFPTFINWKGCVLTMFADLTSAQTACTTVTVTELKANSQFSAMTFSNRPQVSCAGHTGGSAYERQFLGFNSGL